jgi:hypothetical protein
MSISPCDEATDEARAAVSATAAAAAAAEKEDDDVADWAPTMMGQGGDFEEEEGEVECRCEVLIRPVSDAATCEPWAGTYTRQLFSSTSAASDTKHTPDTP